MNMKERISRIVQALAREYRSPALGNHSDPIDKLVLTLLSEGTDESQCIRAFQNLRKAFPMWNNVVEGAESDVASAIRIVGMARRRSTLIKSALKAIADRFGDIDLSRISTLKTETALRELLALPGLTKQSARYILLNCFGRSVLPVDIHMYRLAVRLGIIARTVSYEQSHEAIEAVVPWYLRRRFHVNAVAHGRERCAEVNPKCTGCAISRFCSVPNAIVRPSISVRPKPLAIELFCGAGGMSQGFAEAGFEIVQAIEKDERAGNTFKENHRATDLLVGDIADIDPLAVARRVSIRRGDLTAIIGGPPCQGFSESNRRTRSLLNPRNHLYVQFFRFVESLRPKWFVLENVAGLRTLAEGEILNAIVARSRQIGYSTNWRELNAVDYGVPQIRRRIFVVGNRIGASFEFPSPTHGLHTPFVTVRQAIADLPFLRAGAQISFREYVGARTLSAYQTLIRNGNIGVDGHLVTNSSPLVIARYKHIKQGQNWQAIPDELMDNYADSSRCHTGIYYRLKWDEPSKVIGNFRKNMLVHPSQNRGLSVREAARIQSFPDDYRFVGSIGFQQQQVADAVPPLLAQAVAEAVLASMKRRFNELNNNTKGV